MEYLEKNQRSLKSTIKKLGGQLQQQAQQLEEYRKKDRLFNLQKRCIDDSIRKANLYFKKMTQATNSANGLQSA
jgi:hypothetical protein